MSALTPELEQRAKQVVGQVLEQEPSSIDDHTSAETLPAWDSLRHFQLIMALENAFGVSFSMDEVAELRSFAAIKEALGRDGR